MKKIILMVIMLFFACACVTTSSQNAQFVSSAIIRGYEIHVTDTTSRVQDQLGNPDAMIGNEWHYKGKTKDEPTYILFVSGNVDRIAVIQPQKEE